MKIPVSFLTPGMILSRPVYGAKGEFLLNKGVTITARQIFALRRCGVLAVHVECSGGIEEDLEVKNALEESTRVQVMTAVQAWSNGGGNFKGLSAILDEVKGIVEEILSGKVPVGGLAEISSADAYTFAHSVDVCVLSVFTGTKLGYKKPDLLRLGVGSLLHDLGKTKVPPEILNKPGKLTPVEFREIKKHPAWGYKILLEDVNDQLDPNAMNIVLNHHERYDGTGYPRQLKGKEIDEMASICSVADVYNAMTTDRVYRKALPAHEAYEMIAGGGGTMFDYRISSVFLSCIDPYPVGTLVQLSNKETALVIATNSSLPFRPIVRLIQTMETIDLKKELSLVITGLASMDEIRKVVVNNDNRRSQSVVFGRGGF